MQTPWRSLREPVRRMVRVWLPTGVLCLLAVNVTAFLAQCGLGGLGKNPLESWGALRESAPSAGWIWQPLTCLFLHGNGLALAAGMGLLVCGGRRLEAIVGRRHLGLLYLVGGAAGAWGQMATDWLSHAYDHRVVPNAYLGSLPAALAIFTAYACIMPEARLRLAGWPVAMEVTVRRLALLAAAAAAGLMVWDFYARPLPAPAAAWLIGALAGCLYARCLGFGQRVTAEEIAPPAANAAVSSLIHAPTLDADAGTTLRQIPGAKTSAPRIVAAATSAASSAASSSSAAVTTAPRFTENERRMSARQYIAERIDPILDKISQQGIGSLTDEERALLEKGREKISQQGK